MSNQTKFILDADAAKAVQEFLKFRDAEKKTEDGIKSLAGSARTSEAAVIASAKGMAREYELAGERMNRAIPLPRTIGGSFIPRARGGTLDLAALPSSRLRNPSVPVPGEGVMGYAMRSEVELQSNLDRFNKLLDHGNQIHAKAQTLEQLDFERRTRNVELYAAKQQQASEDVRSLGSQAIAAAGSLALIGGAATTVFHRLDEMSQNVLAFEDTMRPLLSLGDNFKIAPQLRQQVLNLSTAYGIPTADVASGSFMLQSAASNFSAGKRNDILTAALQLTQTTGGNFQSGAVAITKLMQDFGEEMTTAERAASKLVFTEDKAAITIDQLSQLLPDVLPAAKALGYSFDDISAATIVASQSLGNSEKMLTGERNMFIDLSKAVKDGVIHQGTFIEQLKELSRFKPAMIEKIFGERTFPVVEALINRIGDLKQALKDVGAMEDDYLGKKGAAAWSDPGTAMANILRSAGAANANFDAGNDNPSQTKDLAALALSKYGARKMLPNWAPQWMTDWFGAANYVGSEWLPDKLGIGGSSAMRDQLGIGTGGLSLTMKKGVNEQIKTLLAAKNYDAAYTLTETFGKYTGSAYATKAGGFQWTGGREALQLNKLRQQGYDLTPDDFNHYLSLKETGSWGPQGAQAFLEAFHHGGRINAGAGIAAGAAAGAAAAVNAQAADKMHAAALEMGKHAKTFAQASAALGRAAKERNRNVH